MADDGCKGIHCIGHLEDSRKDADLSADHGEGVDGLIVEYHHFPVHFGIGLFEDFDNAPRDAFHKRLYSRIGGLGNVPLHGEPLNPGLALNFLSTDELRLDRAGRQYG